MQKLAYVILFYCFCLPLFAQNDRKIIMLEEKRTLLFKEEKKLNSPQREANLCLAQNDRVLLFMSGRGGQSWSNPVHTTNLHTNRLEADGDIWYSQKNVKEEWSAPQVAAGISTNDGEDEPNMSENGQILYYQSWGMGWQKNGGPYYAYDLKEKIITGLGSGITQFFVDRQNEHTRRSNKMRAFISNDYATDGMTISKDGKIFIVAVGEYIGKMDLYISRKDTFTGKWSYLKRLEISTKGDERTPFLAPDGKTLYFSSDSYNSLGGLDIFYTTLYDDDRCGDIYNVGEPINTKTNDCGFIANHDGSVMFIVRNDDIVSISFPKNTNNGTDLPAIQTPEIKEKKD
jgi:hypothetical protein